MWQVNPRGWLREARVCRSPNFDKRPAADAIDLLVVHYISLPPGQFGGAAIEAFFQNRLDHGADPFFEQLRGVKVSAHFLVRRSGEVVQFVSTLDRAWHAGESQFTRGAVTRQRCNDFSIGIELEGDSSHDFTSRQYRSLTSLTKALVRRHALRDLAGHSDIAPGRKFDPGPHFDWARFVNAVARTGLHYRF